MQCMNMEICWNHIDALRFFQEIKSVRPKMYEGDNSMKPNIDMKILSVVL